MCNFWQDEKEIENSLPTPSDVIDVHFHISGKTLPVDHAWALRQAMLAQLPWLEEEPFAAIHPIHVAASGNGWQRPESGGILQLSHRTLLHLRVPYHRLKQTLVLGGATIALAGYPLSLTKPRIKPLSRLTTLFARQVIGSEDESEFLQELYLQFQHKQIEVRKLLCGRLHRIHTPDGELTARSVMLAKLDLQHSFDLQRTGIAQPQLLGCGIFIPHKGIEAVGTATQA